MVKKDETPTPTNLLLPRWMRLAIEEVAKNNDRTVSAEIREAIRERINDQNG